MADPGVCMSRHFGNEGKPRPAVEWIVTYGCKDGHEQVAVPACDICASSLVDGRQRCARCVWPMVVIDLSPVTAASADSVTAEP